MLRGNGVWPRGPKEEAKQGGRPTGRGEGGAVGQRSTLGRGLSEFWGMLSTKIKISDGRKVCGFKKLVLCQFGVEPTQPRIALVSATRRKSDLMTV